MRCIVGAWLKRNWTKRGSQRLNEKTLIGMNWTRNFKQKVNKLLPRVTWIAVSSLWRLFHMNASGSCNAQCKNTLIYRWIRRHRWVHRTKVWHAPREPIAASSWNGHCPAPSVPPASWSRTHADHNTRTAPWLKWSEIMEGCITWSEFLYNIPRMCVCVCVHVCICKRERCKNC